MGALMGALIVYVRHSSHQRAWDADPIRFPTRPRDLATDSLTSTPTAESKVCLERGRRARTGAECHEGGPNAPERRALAGAERFRKASHRAAGQA
jgi:hypothetical protein